MLTAGFHALRRHDPKALVQIDLTPNGAEYLTAAGGSEDQELKRAGGDGSRCRSFVMNSGTSVNPIAAW